MKKIITYGFILGAICVIASGLLAGVYSLTRPRIIIQAQKQEEATLKEVFPAAGRFQQIKSEEGETVYYKVYAKDDSFLGVAFKAYGKGYSGQIETMVGMDIIGTIETIKILNQSETPGLGVRITEEPFTGQFNRKKVRDLSKVQAITGATISSKAVIDSVRKKAQEIEGLIKNDPKDQ